MGSYYILVIKQAQNITLILILIAGQALAFDPLRIIGHLTASQPSPNDFATDFVCVGDQNGDGYDDLLVNHDPYKEISHNPPFANRVELYFGGREMDDQPDFVIEGSQQGPIAFDRSVFYIGRLTDSPNPYWAILSRQYTDNYRISYSRVLVFEAGDALDNQPEYILNSPVGRINYGFGISMSKGRRMQPFDFNGDGYNDLLCSQAIDTTRDTLYSRMVAYFGGEEFDTIPDWSGYWKCEWQIFEASTGGDINGDGFGDVIAGNVHGHRSGGSISIYLGTRWNIQENILHINTLRTYGEDAHFLGSFVGGIGDFNGDGLLDLSAHRLGADGWGPAAIFILAETSDWIVSVKEMENSQFDYNLSLSRHPNPFNSSTTIRYSTGSAAGFWIKSGAGSTRLAIYDLSGREMAELGRDEGGGMKGPPSPLRR